MANALRPPEQEKEDVLGKTIIIVEDDPSNAEVLNVLLQTDNLYQVTCFRSGREALANVQMIQSLNPVLFILDYYLPSMTALHLYESLHASRGLENVPTIILSASRISNVEKDHMSQLGLILIPKPYDIDDLLATIEQVIS